jgi:hypothetical protein
MGWWQIKGSRADLSAEVSSVGALSWSGRGEQVCRITGFELDSTPDECAYLATLQSASCSWTITALTSDELTIDPAGDGLFARAVSAPEASHARIKLFARPTLIGFQIVVPTETFERVSRALEVVLLSHDLTYGISMGFHGFRSQQALTNTPTWIEFMAGKPCFEEKVSLWIAPPSVG